MDFKSNETNETNKDNKTTNIEKINDKKDIKLIAWICTAVAVSIGIIITKNPSCLWAFFFPYYY